MQYAVLCVRGFRKSIQKNYVYTRIKGTAIEREWKRAVTVRESPEGSEKALGRDAARIDCSMPLKIMDHLSELPLVRI